MLTITAPATSNNLVGLSYVKGELGISGTAEDAALKLLINRASDVIARHCRRTFVLETVSEQIRLPLHQEDIMLSRYPVQSISSIEEDGEDLDDEDDFEIDKETGILSRLYKGSPCWWPRSKTVVVYSAGYTLANMPGALRQACLQLIKAYYIGVDRDPLLRSESIDAISSATYYTGESAHLPPDVQGLLKPFRKIK